VYSAGGSAVLRAWRGVCWVSLALPTRRVSAAGQRIGRSSSGTGRLSTGLHTPGVLGVFGLAAGCLQWFLALVSTLMPRGGFSDATMGDGARVSAQLRRVVRRVGGRRRLGVGRDAGGWLHLLGYGLDVSLDVGLLTFFRWGGLGQPPRLRASHRYVRCGGRPPEATFIITAAGPLRVIHIAPTSLHGPRAYVDVHSQTAHGVVDPGGEKRRLTKVLT